MWCLKNKTDNHMGGGENKGRKAISDSMIENCELMGGGWWGGWAK